MSLFGFIRKFWIFPILAICGTYIFYSGGLAFNNTLESVFSFFTILLMSVLLLKKYDDIERHRQTRELTRNPWVDLSLDVEVGLDILGAPESNSYWSLMRFLLPKNITNECFGDLFEQLEEMADSMPAWRLQLHTLNTIGLAVLFTLRQKAKQALSGDRPHG